MENTHTIKTDETVHKTLEALKYTYRANTFNEVLRQELGLIPEPTASEMGAYLPDELKQFLGAAIAIADSYDGLESVVYEEPSAPDEPSDAYSLHYVLPSGGPRLAEIVASEDRVALYYLSFKSALRRVGWAEYDPEDGVTSSADGTIEAGLQTEILNQFSRKLNGAIDRWAEDKPEYDLGQPRNRIKLLKTLIREIGATHEDGIPVERVLEISVELGMDRDEAEEEISKLKNMGEICEPEKGYLQLVA